VTWEELAECKIAIDPQLRLELRLTGRAPIQVKTRAHLARNPLTIYVTELEAIKEDTAGGRVIASLFEGGDTDKLALAWARAWDKAEKGQRGEVTLAQDIGNEEELISLFEQSKGLAAVGKLEKKKKAPTTRTVTVPEVRLEPRRLKSMDELSEKFVDLGSGDKTDLGKPGTRRGLRVDTPSGRSIGLGPAFSPAPLAYSDEEKELLALEILHRAINGDSVELKDYHHLRGIGADAKDKLCRYFEIKGYTGSMPDEVTLTANEAERAFRDGDKYFLVVIAGLEKGYDTQLKIFSNPLRVLQLKPNTSVSLKNISTSSHCITVHFPDQNVDSA
jgi:hypothetical protein